MMLEHSELNRGEWQFFATVYLGMFLGGLPRLKLIRSGLARGGKALDHSARAWALQNMSNFEIGQKAE
jgi:hypothetical protein